MQNKSLYTEYRLEKWLVQSDERSALALYIQ
jgi:hypothetical protein